MQTVHVELGERSYDILIGTGLLDWLGERMTRVGLSARALIVTDPAVNRLHGGRARASLSRANVRVETLELPGGEQNKQISTILRAYDHLIAANYTRATTVVALGGGVIGDMAGFIAATYMRGVQFVQIPTTLLAMVDSSVGGKTGVNHALAKNMIGAFYQPRLVLIDLDTLRTLPAEEFRAGYAEVVKYGVIWDEALFSELEANCAAIFAHDPDALERAIHRSCEIKAEVVSKDERESGLRAILNFGHTFGHALEAVTNYAAYRHGEAVSIGMVAAARTAVELGIFDADSCKRIETHLAASGLPARFPAQTDTAALIGRFNKDKKALEGRIRFVLPDRIGHVVIRDDVPVDVLARVVHNMKQGNFVQNQQAAVAV